MLEEGVEPLVQRRIHGEVEEPMVLRIHEEGVEEYMKKE